MADEESDGFDKAAHDKYAPDHSGKFGHYCPEWDYLWICQDCDMEFSCCGCFPTEADQCTTTTS